MAKTLAGSALNLASDMINAWTNLQSSTPHDAKLSSLTGAPSGGHRLHEYQFYAERWRPLTSSMISPTPLTAPTGSMHLRGSWVHEGRSVSDGVVVSLGLVEADAEVCNGVIVRVTDDELAELDWRERDYERTDITERVWLERDVVLGAPVVTYVPRPSAVERYEVARDAGRAAVRVSYWDLVTEAFDGLGSDHLDRFLRTPHPDVPIADITLTRRHR